jgi:hypothetical protein
MKIPSLLFILVWSVVWLLPLSGQEYTWTGEGLSPDFSNEDNWMGGEAPTPSGTANELFFGDSENYFPYVDQGSYRFRKLIVTADAKEGYELDGSSLSAYYLTTSGIVPEISNQSLFLLTILNDISFDRNGSGSRSVLFDTGRSGILWTGFGSYPGTLTFTKQGSGTLEIRGSQSNGEGTVTHMMLGGRLLFDLTQGATVRDGTVFSSSTASHGFLVEIQGEDQVLSLATPVWGGNAQGGGSVANRYRFAGAGEDGLTVTLATLGNRIGGNWSTQHFELSNATLTLTSAPSLTNGLLGGSNGYRITVNDGVKTGFATLNENNEMVRYTGYTELPSGSWSSSTNYVTTGGTVTNNSNNSFHSLTIQGAGILQGTGYITSGVFLMEEGVVGDYVIDKELFQYTHIHQYSMTGKIVLKQFRNNANNILVKAGPGTVEIHESVDTSYLSRGIWVQQGTLLLNGAVRSVGDFQVQYDAVLAGKGHIGGGTTGWYSGVTHSHVEILGGAILDATNAGGVKALSIDGVLTLDRDSSFRMRLTQDRGDPLSVKTPDIETPPATIVTLNGNLELTLEYAPTLFEWIVLLRTDGTMEGEFLTYNNQFFGGENGNLLTLSYGDNEYEFRIVYDYNPGGEFSRAVALQAIPEPESIALLTGLALASLIVWSRRRTA